MAFAGVFVGEEDRDSIKLVQRISLIHSLIMTTFITVLLFLFGNFVIGIFLHSNNREAVELAIQCVQISCLSLPFHTIVYNFNNYLMGIKRMRFSVIYSFLIECGNLIPITFLMLRITGYEGAWTSKIINMAVLSLIAIIYIMTNKEADSFSDKMVLMPRSFGANNLIVRI